MRDVIKSVLEAVLTTAVPVIVIFICRFIVQKINESVMNSKKITMNDAVQAVYDAVIYTNQVMVNSLKSKGLFDEVKQKEAFQKTYEIASEAISEKAKECIEETFGDFEKWLIVKIESVVNESKAQVEDYIQTKTQEIGF